MDIAFEVAVARLALSDGLAAYPAERWFISHARPVEGDGALITRAVCNDLTADMFQHQPCRPTALRAPMIVLGMVHGQCSYPARRPVSASPARAVPDAECCKGAREQRGRAGNAEVERGRWGEITG